jgi:transposase
MIRPEFLSAAERKELVSLARNGSASHRVARRANAIVLLNDGWSCDQVAKALLLDDDTVRGWFKSYNEHGLKAITTFRHGGSESCLTQAQELELIAWVRADFPSSTSVIGSWIRDKFDLYYSHSGLIALLHRLDLVFRKPRPMPRKLDVDKQETFIANYEKLRNGLGARETIVFVDAVHPQHQSRSAGCWAPKDEKIVIEQNSGRQRLNIHGAIDLETGSTQMLVVEAANAKSTIALLEAIEQAHSTMTWIYVFLDNAKYHHALLVREWLGQPGRRVILNYVPAYCPHLSPIERLWGCMHENVTHNKCYSTFSSFRDAVLGFLIEKVPQCWSQFCESVSDNFRVIDPAVFRVIK